MNESIHRASPMHSQQEYIATGLVLYKNILLPAIHRGIEPFCSRANSLPGANRPIGPWPIRSLAKSLPGAFALWPFRSLAISFPGTFALWLFRFGHRQWKVCGNGGQSQEVWGTAEVPKAPRSSVIGSRRQRRSRRQWRWAVGRGLCPSPEIFFLDF